MSAYKSTLLKRKTSRNRRVRQPKGATVAELRKAFEERDFNQLLLPYIGSAHINAIGNGKTSVILDVTGRTDTNEVGGGFAGQYCFCKGGCE